MATKVTPKASKGKAEGKGKGKGKAGFKIDPKAKYEVAMPEGFNFDDYKPLKKSNFASDALYLEHRALEAEHKAEKFRKEADEARKFGTRADRAKAKRLAKLNSKMAELRKQLEEQGVDVDELMKSAAAQTENK